MKIIDNKFYIRYSELSPVQRKLYYLQIKNFLRELIFEYNNFNSWFVGLFDSDALLSEDREIFICEYDFQ